MVPTLLNEVFLKRDEELNRLIRYAQGMGVSVRFKPSKKDSEFDAEYVTDGSEITIYTDKNYSKLDKVLALIHELGHHKAFIKDGRKLDPKVEEALVSEENKKVYRKRILDMEIEDSNYWEDVYKDTNCQFKIEKLHKEREFQVWSYETYYETGEFPTRKEISVKKKELKKKYGC